MSKIGEFKRNNYLVNHTSDNPYENNAFTITAEQQKEIEHEYELNWMLCYLKKAIGVLGDIKLSEAIDKIKDNIEPKLEPVELNIRLESKTVEYGECEDWIGWREDDGTEIIKRRDNNLKHGKRR